MNKSNQTKSLKPVKTEVDEEVLHELDKAAASKKLSRSEFLRQCISQALQIKSYEDNIDRITKIIRQELRSEISLDDFRTVTANNTERIIKVLIKLAKPLIAGFLLQIRYLDEISPPENNSVIERVSQSVNLSMQYMSDRDDEFFSDVDKLVKMISKM